MAATRPAAVGGFVLGGLALAAAAVLFFGGSHLFKETTQAVVYFEGSVAGLAVGAPVTFRGVRVGSVQRMALVVAADGVTARIPVYLELEPGKVVFEGGDRSWQGGVADQAPLLEAGFRAQLVSQSLVTGQLGVELDIKPDAPKRLVGGEPGILEIAAVPSDLQQLRETLAELRLQEVVQTAQRTLAVVERLAGRLDAELGPLAESARRSADAATRSLDTADTAVQRLQADASATLGELGALAADGRRLLDARGAELGRIMATADRIARQAETLLVSLNGLTAPRSAFRGDLEISARDLAAALASLRGLARAVERDPSALLTGRGGQ